MGFTKKDNIYRITRMTGNRDNILSVSFSENNSTTIDVIECDFSIGYTPFLQFEV